MQKSSTTYVKLPWSGGVNDSVPSSSNLYRKNNKWIDQLLAKQAVTIKKYRSK